MSKRPVCRQCQYPTSVCICEGVRLCESALNIVVLQHSNESKHKKNSVKLLQLCMPNMRVEVGKIEQDFRLLEHDLKDRNVALFYPSEHSQSLEQNLTAYQEHAFDTLLFIDASWRQAYGLYQLLPWLHHLKQWHYAAPPVGQYNIRKAKVSNSLSTLEAVAYGMELGHQENSKALLESFAYMQSRVFAKHPNVI